MNIISKNSKTGFSVNFPIEETCDKTCPFYTSKTCYGLKGRFLFKNVQNSNKLRLFYYRESPSLYFNLLKTELNSLQKSNIRHVRINGIGDTPDKQWASMFAEVANEFPYMQFWVATRKQFWNEVEVPDNVTVRYSQGIDGEITSSVTDNKDEATCPATTGKVKTCSECGFHCWYRGVNQKHITYAKH